MTASAFLAFVHHAAAFLVVGTVMVELVLTRSELTATSARSLLRMDAAYGISATILLAVGFVRVFYTEKGAAYYFGSGTFIAKIALFAIVGILSIYPTVQFMKLRKALQQNQVPAFEPDTRRRIRRSSP